MQPALDSQIVTRLRWADTFDGDLSAHWTDDELIISADNRTGNAFIQPDGSIDMNANWHRLPGRWAALYDEHRDKCQFVRDGQLVMKGHAVETPNPYRDNYDYNGETHRYGDWMLYTSWLTARETVGPGSVIEVRVNLEKQTMRGHRWNVWGMPVKGIAYDADITDAEIDMPEVENPSRVENSDFGYRALLKVVAGDAGDTPNGNVDLRHYGINLREGWHTFTTVWRHDGSLEWYVDGILCNNDPRSVLVPIKLYVAREMNSGVKSADSAAWQNREDGPKKPEDPGLTGQSVILDVDLIDEDEVIIDYISVYDIVEDGERPDKKVGEPDVDLGTPDVIDELTIEEQITLLADQYEIAERRIAEQDAYIEELTRTSLSTSLELSEKVDELAELRSESNETIAALKAREAELLAEVDALKKKPIPERPTAPPSPPVSKKSRDRLAALLRRARGG